MLSLIHRYSYVIVVLSISILIYSYDDSDQYYYYVKTFPIYNHDVDVGRRLKTHSLAGRINFLLLNEWAQ